MAVPQTSPVINVANGERWHELIESVFGSVDMHLGDRTDFRGKIRRSILGEIELSDVATTFEDARRTRKNIAVDLQEHFVVVMPQLGNLYLSQDDRDCVVVPGALAFFYLNSPHRYFHGAETRILDLKIPAPMVRAHVREPERLTAMTFFAHGGLPKITLDFVTSMANELLTMPASVPKGYIGKLIDTIALLIDSQSGRPQADRSVPRDAIRSRCIALIEAHISDPELGPEWLAGRCGISNRYVHAVFQEMAETIGEYIRNRRLAICYDRLCRASTATVQIKDVALSTGFRSVSHFCNCFKAKYGISPRDVRRAEY